jgi:signal transduction histidine kinase
MGMPPPARLAATPWVVLIEFSEAAVLRGPHTVGLYLALITGVLVLLGGVLGWGMSRGITRPLTDLAGTAGAIAGGDYTRRAAVRRGDELGEVAAAFNHMAATVDQMHRALEEQVAARTAELQMVNRELEAFSYSVSHDLRAPLRSIDGFSQALLEDYGDVVDETGHRHLQRVRTASQRMGTLIDDLLGLAQMSRGQLDLEALDLSAIAREVVADLAEHEAPRMVAVSIAPHLVAHGDRRLIRVALSNLLQNAWKFTRRRAEPRIEFGRTARAFFVRDNGVGFDMAYADKLFGAFQRLHSSDDFEGTGIGLATVQRVVRRHGGEIWADGEVDRGATIWFTLPFSQAGNGTPT